MDDIAFSGRLSNSGASVVADRVRKLRRGLAVSTIMLGLGLSFAILGAAQIGQGNSGGRFDWCVLASMLVGAGAWSRWSEVRASRQLVAEQVWAGRVGVDGVSLESLSAETLFRWAAFEGIEEHSSTLVVLWLESGSVLPLEVQMFSGQPSFNLALERLRLNVANR